MERSQMLSFLGVPPLLQSLRAPVAQPTTVTLQLQVM